MKIFIRNSKVEFQKNVPSGGEYEVKPDYLTSDYPVSAGYYLDTSRTIHHLAVYEGRCGVSSLISVDGISKIKISGVFGNQYTAVLAFFNDATQTIGYGIDVIKTTSGDYEWNVPSHYRYVRFGQNIDISGTHRPWVIKFVVA